MTLIKRLEESLTRTLNGGVESVDAQVIASAYDRATSSVLDTLLFKFRAACFDASRIAEGIEEKCDPPDGEVRCLDVGCNIGAKTPLLLSILRHLNVEKVDVEGIDLSPVAIETAKKTNPFPNVTYTVQDFLEMQIEEGSFDYVVLTAVWHHLQDTKAALKKAEKALGPNGVLLIFNGFYPENVVLRFFALFLQRLYRSLEERTGVYYSKPLVSDVVKQASDATNLVFRGAFVTNFPTNLFNTKVVVLQKEKE